MIAPIRIGYPLDMWAMFGMGVALYGGIRTQTADGAERRESLGGLAAILALSVALCVEVTFFVARNDIRNWVSPMWHSVPVAFSVALGAVVCIYLLRFVPKATAESGVWGWFGKLGIFSYSLYLVHFMLIGLATQLLRILHLSRMMYPIRFVFTVSVAVLGGWIFFFLFERPFIKMRAVSGAKSVANKGTGTPLPEVAP